MGKLAAPVCVLIGVMLSGVWAQTPPVSSDQQYLFIDGQSTRSRLTRTVNLSRVRERLTDAGDKGYAVIFVARFSSSVNLLLKRDGGGARSYRLVATSREGPFLNELNQAGAQGFRVLTEGIKAFEEGGTFGDQTTWVAVMGKQSGTPRFKYSVTKGAKEGEQALAESVTTGRVLAGILGRQGFIAPNTLLFFEEVEGGKGTPNMTGQREYRILATGRTSSIQKDLIEAATERFRVIGSGSGYMTAVMAREPGSTPETIEYRLIATIRLETGVKELQAAGAEGFRLAAISENGPEGVFVLHRTLGTPDRVDYQVLRLQEATANQVLLKAEADGYRIAGLLNDLVVLERP